MAQIPVDVWHVNQELMARLRADKSKEAKRLFRQLDNREFFSNALSYIFSISLVMMIFGIISGSAFFAVFSLIMAIISIWGSDRLKSSAMNILLDYQKQQYKQQQNINIRINRFLEKKSVNDIDIRKNDDVLNSENKQNIDVGNSSWEQPNEVDDSDGEEIL